MAGKKKQGIAGLKDTTGGARRDDRQSVAKFHFEPITIDAENALTVIYMLRSPEGSVVLRAIASLERFGKKATENLHLLVNSGVFDYVLPLVQYADYLVRRFAQKLIARLCALEEFRQQILSDGNTVNIFVTILEKEDDVVMHEFASLTLAELSSECFAASRILQIEGCVDTLYLRLTADDPDVQKNCLDTMKNLLNEIDGIQYFLSSPHFDVKPILELTASNYPVIQITALRVLEQLTSWSMDNRILFAFRDSMGMEVILGIVENTKLTDLHMSALDILLKVVDNPTISDYLQQSGCLQKLIVLLDSYTDKFYAEKILGALARVSQSNTGRKVLHANNMGKIFGEYLRSGWSGIQEPACLGVSSMAQYPPALESIMSTKPTSYLLGIVTDSTRDWKLREMGSYALNVLSHEDYRVGEELIVDKKFEQLLPLLKRNKEIPVEAVLYVLQIFIGISASEKCRNIVINENVMETLMDLIQDTNEAYLKPARVQVAAMECLSSFVIEDGGRALFQALGGASKLVGCLKSKFASIRQWAALLITQMSYNICFVKSFIRQEGLQWLLEHKEMRYSAPSWESAIEALFHAFLPAKFAFTGRLDLHDLTEEGFFILRHQRKLFFILDDVLEGRASPAYPVYVANFDLDGYCGPNGTQESKFSASQDVHQTKQTAPQKKEPRQEMSDQQKPKMGGHNTADKSNWEGSQHSRGSCDRSDADSLFSINIENFGSCPDDPYLGDYLMRLRGKLLKEMELSFRDPQWLGIHPALIRQRAQILGRFVADEMSGPSPDPVCRDHYLEMHINDLRYELGTNVIPIGHVRVGSYLERAFLFKILADKVGLPCALVRGTYGRAWVEIAIPLVNVNETRETKETQTAFPLTPPPSLRSTVVTDYESTLEEAKTSTRREDQLPCYRNHAKTENFLFPPLNASRSNAFPTRLLKANAIVDLVHEPGKILQIHSYEADEYRGCFLYSNRRTKVTGN